MNFDRNASGKLKSAVMNGDMKAVKRLIKGGTDVNQISVQKKWETTLLHEAVITGSTEIVELLLNAGAHINATDLNRNTALHLACRRDNLPVVGALLQHGATLTIENEDGYTALNMALSRAGPEVVQALLHAGAVPEPIGQRRDTSPLTLAVLNERLCCVTTLQMLIERGASMKSADPRAGADMLERYVHLDHHPHVLATFLQHGADPFMSDSKFICMRKGGSLRDDGLPLLVSKYVLKQIRKKYIKPAEVTKLLEQCTDQDIANDLLTVDQSERLHEITRSTDEKNSQSEPLKKMDRLSDDEFDQSRLVVQTRVTSLSHKCRVVIRRYLSSINGERSTKQALMSLPLPKPLLDYVSCKELISLLGISA